MKQALLVSHDRATQVILTAYCRRAGLESEVVNSLLEAVTRLDTPHLFELICVEWQLPDGYGMELIPSVRRQSKGDAVPILATSADLGAADVVRANRDDCLALGFDGFLPKPILREQFFELLYRFGLQGDSSQAS